MARYPISLNFRPLSWEVLDGDHQFIISAKTNHYLRQTGIASCYQQSWMNKILE